VGRTLHGGTVQLRPIWATPCLARIGGVSSNLNIKKMIIRNTDCGLVVLNLNIKGTKINRAIVIARASFLKCLFLCITE